MNISKIINAIEKDKSYYGISGIELVYENSEVVNVSFQFSKGKALAIEFCTECSIDPTWLIDNALDTCTHCYYTPFTQVKKVYWNDQDTFKGINIDTLNDTVEHKVYTSSSKGNLIKTSDLETVVYAPVTTVPGFTPKSKFDGITLAGFHSSKDRYYAIINSINLDKHITTIVYALSKLSNI